MNVVTEVIHCGCFWEKTRRQWRRNRKVFLLLFELAKPHRSEGAITAGPGGGHLGTETLHSRVSWICSAILWSSSPRCPLFTLQSATGFPINLSSLLSSPEDSHPTQFGTVHPTWPPTLEGPQCHKSSGWEAFDLVYVGNADLGSNARHLPTPQQSAASAVGSDAQIPNVFERNKYYCVTVVIQMLGIE